MYSIFGWPVFLVALVLLLLLMIVELLSLVLVVTFGGGTSVSYSTQKDL
jgi:hypothetical protein